MAITDAPQPQDTEDLERRQRETIARLELHLRLRRPTRAQTATVEQSGTGLMVRLEGGLDRSRIVGLVHAFESYPGVLDVSIWA